MGIGITSAQNLLELNELGLLKDFKSVIEIGSQEIHIQKNDFKELIEIAGLDVNLVENIPNIKNWPFSPRASSKYLYEILGIKDYKSIDINGKYGAIVHDLNKPFNDTSMFNKFDIATDFGSCEHVFNVSECYKTLHKLLKPGGYLIIDQAILKGNGYFKFDEVFFEGIAAANNYKIIFSSYVITTGEKTKNGSYYQFHIPRNHKLLDVLDYSKLGNIDKSDGIGIFAVMQKITDEEFKTPYQGTIYNDIYNIAGFNRLFMREPLSYTFIPSAKITVEEASFVQIIKALKNLFTKKIRIVIRKIIMSLK